ncbi:MAG: GNAT family N-acetyltransferase [Anaerolineae bacterium]
MSGPHDALNLPRSLGDGLVLRLGTPADTEALIDFNIRVLLAEDEAPMLLRAWIRDLISGRHPTTTAADFVLVEDTQAGKIVSSTCLIPQVWVYEDIPFAVGRPELVGTDPAYRRRGLVRTIFGTIHALSAAYGHLVQGITGIPWFYRQFGYEFALPLGGRRDLNVNDVPALKEGETEPYHIRQATEADISTLMRLYQRQCADKSVSTLIDEEQWRYDLTGRTPGSDYEVHLYCILEVKRHLLPRWAAPGFRAGQTNRGCRLVSARDQREMGRSRIPSTGLLEAALRLSLLGRTALCVPRLLGR